MPTSSTSAPTSSTSGYVLSEVARSYLPPLSFELACERMNTNDELTEFERIVIYVHYLVARGDFAETVSFLDTESEDTRRRIVNYAMYHTWWGNALHTCLYWNTGQNALNIYRYLVGCGAVAVLDYYEQYPWEQSGSRYICPLLGVNVATDFSRDLAEFSETYTDVLRFFGPESGAGATPIRTSPPDDLVASCRLHHPLSLYTRNSNGHYGTYAPICNGCSVGQQEMEDHEVAERVRAHTQALQELWGTRYNDESLIEAQNISEMLIDDISLLVSMTNVIATPVDYGQRMLDMHSAMRALHQALPNPALVETLYNSVVRLIRNGRYTGLNSAPILLAAQTRILAISSTSLVSRMGIL